MDKHSHKQALGANQEENNIRLIPVTFWAKVNSLG